MNKALAAVGVLGTAGLLSLCDLCGTPARSAALVPSVPAAYAAPPAQAPAQVPTQVATKTVTLTVNGMTCGGCVIGTRTVLTRLPGVTKADVRYQQGRAGRAVVTYDPRQTSVGQMVAAVRTLGYTASPMR